MDSLTQVALGSSVGYAVLGSKVGRKAIIWGAILGTLPDLDVLIPFDDAVAAFTYHRSFSHSLFVHLLVSPIIVWLILKVHSGMEAFKQRWFWLVFLCLSTHAILDSFTVYGTQLLWPFTEYPFGVSNLFIVDPLVTLPLILGVAIALLPKVSLCTAYRSNNLGLAISGIYICWSLIAKVYIDNKVELALAERAIEYEGYVSTPAPFTTLLWRVVVMSDGKYYEGYASVFDNPSDVSLDEYATYPELLAELQTEWGIGRLQWFTQGFYSVRQKDQDVILSDLRMGIECAYVFNFKVAEQNEDGIKVGSFEKFTQRPDLGSLPYIWDRVWDSKVSLAPAREALDNC